MAEFTRLTCLELHGQVVLWLPFNGLLLGKLWAG